MKIEMSSHLLALPKDIRSLIGEIICEDHFAWMRGLDAVDCKRARDAALFSLSLTCKPMRRIYYPMLLKDVTLQIDHIGTFLSLISEHPDLADLVESVTFANLSASRRFPSRGPNETIQEAAFRVWHKSGQRCLEALPTLLQVHCEAEEEDDEDEDALDQDTNTLTPRHFEKHQSFKASLLYLYYAKGAIIDCLRNLRCLNDETYVVFPLIRRSIRDDPLGGLQSLRRLILENEGYDSFGTPRPVTRGRNMVWCLLFLPSLVQAKFKVGMDQEDISYLKDNFDHYNQASRIREVILSCCFIQVNTESPTWNAKLIVDNLSKLLLSTKLLQSLDLTIPSFSIPDFFSCLKTSISSSFGTLRHLKLRGDPKKTSSYSVPEFSGRPTLTFFANLETLILDSDFILSLQVSRDGIPMPSKRSSIDGIMRLPDKLPLDPIKLRNLSTLTVLSHPISSVSNPLSSQMSLLNSSNSSNQSSSTKRMESILRSFISEHYLAPNLKCIQLVSHLDSLSTSSKAVLERKPSSAKSGRKSSNSLDTLLSLCDRQNLRLNFLEPGTGGESCRA